MTNELQAIRNQLTILERRLEALEGGGLKVADDYWYIDSEGVIQDTIWTADEFDTMRAAIGNVFKTLNEARSKYGKLEALQKLSKLTRPFDPLSENWCIYINEHGQIDYYSEEVNQYLYGNYYFNTKEEAIQAVQQIGEDIIRECLFN